MRMPVSCYLILLSFIWRLKTACPLCVVDTTPYCCAYPCHKLLQDESHRHTVLAASKRWRTLDMSGSMCTT